MTIPSRNGRMPRILVLPRPSLYRQLFTPQTDAALRRLGQVTFHDEERDLTSEDLAEQIRGFDIVLTGWRSPRFTEEVLSAAQRLRLIAHSAGSVKFMLDGTCMARGITVTTAAAAMARPVAEMGLLLTLLLLRPVHRADQALKSGADWRRVKSAGMAEELSGQRVGVIGAGHTGRAYIRLIRCLGGHVQVYDPHLSHPQTQELGAEKCDSLHELLAGCRIVSLQAPATPQTHHMIGRTELALLRDGAILINTARSWLVDPDALLEELQSGRISAALDVFDEEPLPVDSPFRRLENAIITPHLGAATYEGYFRQGQITVEEIGRFCAGRPLQHAITPQMLATMA